MCVLGGGGGGLTWIFSGTVLKIQAIFVIDIEREILWSQKSPCLSPLSQEFIGNFKGEGVFKGKDFKGMTEAKLEFPVAWGSNQRRKSLP